MPSRCVSLGSTGIFVGSLCGAWGLAEEAGFVPKPGRRCRNEWVGMLPVGGLHTAWTPELEGQALDFCAWDPSCGGMMRYVPPPGESLDHTNCHLWCGRPQFCWGEVQEEDLKESSEWITYLPTSGSARQSLCDSNRQLPDDDYDFVVVGGGSGGCSAATRLGQSGKNTLLIEAGPRGPKGLGDSSWMPTDPNNRPDLWFKARVDLEGGGPKLVPYQGGRLVGGTSALNGKIYTRGSLSKYQKQFGWTEKDTVRAYEEIESSFGNASLFAVPFDELPWLYRALGDAFRDGFGLEYQKDPHSRGGTTAGLSGRWSFQTVPSVDVDKSKNKSKNKKSSNDNSNNSNKDDDGGRPANDGPEAVGTASKHAMGTRPRASACRALQEQIKSGGSSVALLQDASVLELLTSDARGGGEAIAGVAVALKGRRGCPTVVKNVSARKEVLLAAGVVNTPWLIATSMGIADSQATLRRLGHKDGFVDENFGKVQVDWGVELLVKFAIPCPAPWQVGDDDDDDEDEQKGGRGFSFFAFLGPDQRRRASEEGGGAGGGADDLDSELQLLELCADGRLALRVNVQLLQTKAKGRLKFTKAGPNKFAVIHHEQLDSQDWNHLYGLLRGIFERILYHPVLADQVHSFYPDWSILGDVEKFGLFLKKELNHYQHWTGSTAASIDERLRVRGVQKLRLADASVLDHVPGHTDGPARLVGWRAAEFALAEAEAHHAGSSLQWPARSTEQMHWGQRAADESRLSALGEACLFGRTPGIVVGAQESSEQVCMPVVGLGTGSGNWRDVARTAAAVEQWLKLGGRHLDTALDYHNLLGVAEGLRRASLPREEVFITSKVPVGALGYSTTREAIDRILRELGLSYVDLMLIHWPGKPSGSATASPSPARGEEEVEETPQCVSSDGSWSACRLESWLALEEAYYEGRARHVGVSNYEALHLEELLEANVQVMPAVNQIEYHPWQQRADLLEICSALNISVMAYGSLGGNRFSPKILQSPVLLRLSRTFGRSPAQLLLRWALQQGLLVIPSSNKEARMREFLSLLDFSLPVEASSEIAALGDVQQQRFFQPDPRRIL